MSTDHSDKTFQEQIQPIRREIDAIDAQILSLLARRRDQVKKVVALKRSHRMPVFHQAREENLISNLRNLAEQFHVDPDFIEELYRLILKNSRADQIPSVPSQTQLYGQKT